MGLKLHGVGAARRRHLDQLYGIAERAVMHRADLGDDADGGSGLLRHVMYFAGTT
jgi:hypothetical protein